MSVLLIMVDVNLEGINNTTGLGYQCDCNYAYQLAPDNHYCNGMYVYVYECTAYIANIILL